MTYLAILSLQKVLENKFIRLFSFKRNSKKVLISYFIISFFIFDLSKAESNNSPLQGKDDIQIDYLKSKEELQDYIIDTGDILSIDFQLEMFNGNYAVNPEGEILLPEIDETYVRGLTPSELSELLNKKYLEYIKDPEITVRISTFKPLRVLVRGEVRYPGLYEFPAYKSGSFLNFQKKVDDDSGMDKAQKTNNKGKIESSNQSMDNSFDVKRTSQKVTTISDVIFKAGGVTSSTDLSMIEVIRDVPLSKGGGKKRAFINLYSFLNESDDSNDLRMFDGDSIFLPKLSQSSAKQIPKSVLSGLSPKFITVDIFGRVESPGNIKLPLEATLSDAIDLTGPIKPLSGKIVLIRYEADGTVLKKDISYSARAKRGSKRNPFIKQGDLISVKNSFLGKSTGVIKEFTAPILGIYSTKEIIESFND